MSSVQKTNFRPVTTVLQGITRDFELVDPTLGDPGNAVALVDGEWIILNSTGTKIVRASTISSVGNENTKKVVCPLWFEKGRYDGQAIRKGSLVWSMDYEFETRIYDAAVTVGSGAPITAVDQGLKVATITIGSRNFTGLVGHGGSGDASPIVGYVTRLGTSNGAWLRFRSGFRR